MQVSVLVTNGGEHSPKQWAYGTASRLVNVDSSVIDDRFIEAEEMRLAVTKVLMKHHADVQDSEHAALAANADAHLQTDIDAQGHVDAAMADILEAAKGTRWETQFSDPETQPQIRQLLETDFRTSKQHKREWHQHRANAAAAA